MRTLVTRRRALLLRNARSLTTHANGGLRVGVVGLGAIGTIFFTQLSRLVLHRSPSQHGIHSVEALVKPHHLELLEKHPRLIISGHGVRKGSDSESDEARVEFRRQANWWQAGDGRVRISALTPEATAQREPLDVVLLALKAYDSADVLDELQRHHRDLLKPDTAFVLLQNGMNLSASSRAEYEYAHGVTYVGGRITAPYTVAVTGLATGATYFAPVATATTTATAREQAIMEKLGLFSTALKEAGIHTELLSRDEMQTVLWRKLIVNAAINPVAAILDSPNGNVGACEWSRRCAEMAVREAMAIAALERVDLQCSEEEMIASVLDVAQRTSANVCSTVADLRRGARTEIDAINGALLACAAKHGASAPVTELLYNAVKALETQKRLQRVA